MKKLIIMVLILLISLIMPTLAATVYYEYNDEEIIRDGVWHNNIFRFTSAGWLNINVIKADLSNENVKVDVLLNKDGVQYLENTFQAANKTEDVIAAVNGDFFAWGNIAKTGTSIGPVVKDGKLMTSPDNSADVFAALTIDYEKTPAFYYLYNNIKITNPYGESADVKAINKVDPLDSIILYNSDFAPVSLGSKNHIIEVVVEDGIVAEKRWEMDGYEFKENSYVLTGIPEHCPFLVYNLNVGDEVTLEYNSFDWYETVVGGGTILLKDGQKHKITHSSPGAHPRTAVGYTDEFLYLVTVDGRRLESIGATLDEFADILLDLGIENAINMDGGGSTTMVSAKEADSDLAVVNYLSDTYLRSVANSIGIIYNTAKSEDKDYESYEEDTENHEDSEDDKKNNEDSENNIESNSGSEENYANDKENKEDDEPKLAGVKLELNTKNFELWERRTFSVYPYDKNHAPIPYDDSKLEIEVNNIAIEGYDLIAINNGLCSITINYDGFYDTKEFEIAEKVPIEFLNTNSENLYTLYGKLIEPTTILNKYYTEKIKNKINIYTNNFKIDGKEYKGYSCVEKEDVLFISVDISKEKSLRKTDSKQWTNLIYDLTRTDKQAFILFKETPKGNSDIYEDKLFTDLIEERKNVTVVTPSENVSGYSYNGVNYVTVPSAVKVTVRDILTANYLGFKIIEGKVHFYSPNVFDIYGE